MIEIVFAEFDDASASAMMSCASSPVAIGMLDETEVYLSCAHAGTPRAFGRFRFCTGTRGSFSVRYRAPTDELTPNALLSTNTRLLRRPLTDDAVALKTKL